ncbi:MAG: NAD-dependent epimerase/dehydratase family protein [Methanomicrobiales archaeon]|nr:NAD-dependent epimerase/dehydratase family protein [Methanomicrobiales archaeon]
MKALVTGGSGFLGHHLIHELGKEGIRTVAYDLQSQRTGAPGKLPGKLTWVTGDILDLERLKGAMEGCDLVFHTAAIADIDVAKKIPVETMRVNVVGTATCLEAARLSGVQRFLFASSVYTSGNRGSFYRISKQTGESLCRSYLQEYGLEYTILKYGSLYGRESNHWNFINKVCRDLVSRGEFDYIGSPDAVREYIHISDAARETVRIARNPEFANRSVLITGHQRMKMREFFDMVQEVMGGKVTINYAPLERQQHYVTTPYSFDMEIPVRVNLSQYVDISEGILDCLREAQREVHGTDEEHR